MISSTPTAFNELAQTRLKGMRPEGIDAIERHQPYNRSPLETHRDRLVLLHKMWNADKHHAPMGVGYWAVAATAVAYQPLASDFTAHFGPFHKGQVVARVTAEGAQYDLHPHISLDIGFKTRRPNLAVARYTVSKMYDLGANEVMPDFRRFF